jgi:hypothetical protein
MYKADDMAYNNENKSKKTKENVAFVLVDLDYFNLFFYISV